MHSFRFTYHFAINVKYLHPTHLLLALRKREALLASLRKELSTFLKFSHGCYHQFLSKTDWNPSNQALDCLLTADRVLLDVYHRLRPSVYDYRHMAAAATGEGHHCCSKRGYSAEKTSTERNGMQAPYPPNHRCLLWRPQQAFRIIYPYVYSLFCTKL